MSKEADEFWQEKEKKLKNKIEKTNKVAKTDFVLMFTDWKSLQRGKIITLRDVKKEQEIEFDMLRDIHNFLNGIIYLKKGE